MPETAVILLAHGSRDADWRAAFERLAASLAESAGGGRARVAYLQFSPPTLLDAVTSAAEEGFRRISILPLFISAGGHVARDVPDQAAQARQHRPDLKISILPRIGEDKRFIELVGRLVLEALAEDEV